MQSSGKSIPEEQETKSIEFLGQHSINIKKQKINCSLYFIYYYNLEDNPAYTKLNKHTHILEASTYQGDPQFGNYAGTQCTAIAAYAIAIPMQN